MRSGRDRQIRCGSWRVRASDRTPGDLNEQVVELLAGTTDDISVWRSITSQYRADIFCSLFLAESNEGLEISPETMKALGERGIALGLDIYGACSDEDEKMTLFTWDDIVFVKSDSPANFRPGQKAWIVGISHEDDRKGNYKSQFPEGVVYTIEFEDGSATDVPEKFLTA